MSEAPCIEWTQQHPYLWTGRAEGLPAGTIERGRRFTYINAHGAEHHGFASLTAAQHAAQTLLPEGA